MYDAINKLVGLPAISQEKLRFVTQFVVTPCHTILSKMLTLNQISVTFHLHF